MHWRGQFGEPAPAGVNGTNNVMPHGCLSYFLKNVGGANLEALCGLAGTQKKPRKALNVLLPDGTKIGAAVLSAFVPNA